MFSSLNRRDFLGRHALAPIALDSLLAEEAKPSAGNWVPPDGKPHLPAKAKSVIWLFMNGGVSHMESFDPKPMLTKYAGKTIAETPFAHVKIQKNWRLNASSFLMRMETSAIKFFHFKSGFRSTGAVESK